MALPTNFTFTPYQGDPYDYRGHQFFTPEAATAPEASAMPDAAVTPAPPSVQQNPYLPPLPQSGGSEPNIAQGPEQSFNLSQVPASATAEEVLTEHSPYGSLGMLSNVADVASLAGPVGTGLATSLGIGLAERDALNMVREAYGLPTYGALDALKYGANPFDSMRRATEQDIQQTDTFGRNFGARMRARGITDPFGNAASPLNQARDAMSRAVDAANLGSARNAYTARAYANATPAQKAGMREGYLSPEQASRGTNTSAFSKSARERQSRIDSGNARAGDLGWGEEGRGSRGRSGGGGGCYITTAAVEHMGLSDDDTALTNLRWYRDNVMKQSRRGKAKIKRYYETAPKIVERLDSLKDPKPVYQALFNQYIKPAADSVEEGDFDKTNKIYGGMVKELERALEK